MKRCWLCYGSDLRGSYGCFSRFLESIAADMDSSWPQLLCTVKVDKPTWCKCVILSLYFSSTQYPFIACPQHFVYICLSSGSEASQLQQGRGSWNQGDYWGVHLPKERGAVSDCPHRCPASSQKGPQGALSSFMPCLTSPASLLWRWQLGCQQHCSLHHICRVSFISVT